MGIPFGTQYTATVGGKAWKEVCCENCGEDYLFEVERSVSASSTSVLWLDNQGAQDKASEEAHRQIQQQLDDAIDPVSCPNCGWFQERMGQILKRNRLIWPLVVSLPLGGILMFIGQLNSFPPNDWSRNMLIVGACIMGGGILLACIRYFGFDANRNHPGDGQKNSNVAQESTGRLKKDLLAEQQKQREEWEGRFHRCLLQSMIQISAVDGSIDDSEVERVREIYAQVTGDELSSAEVHDQNNSQLASLHSDLVEFCDQLTDEAKAVYIRAGVAVAAADGEFEASEWKAIASIAESLRMTQQHFDAVMESMKAK